MSRSYRVMIEARKKDIRAEALCSVMVKTFGWEEEDTDEHDGKAVFIGTGCLCGGQSEEDAHNQILKELQRLLPGVKNIRTTWTYLEDLPTTEYGEVE